MDKDLKAKISRWVSAVGIRTAERLLIVSGISSSMAQKLTRGSYPGQPKDLYIELIEAAMQKSA